MFTYMGPPELQPEPPGIEWLHLRPAQRFVSKRLQECSWLQAMEGGRAYCFLAVQRPEQPLGRE